LLPVVASCCCCCCCCLLFKRFQIAQRMKTKEKMKYIESEHMYINTYPTMLSTYQRRALR